MLIKLIWRGFKKQVRSYLLFFFSMIFAVMMYYSFNAMTYEQPLLKGAGTTSSGQIINMLAIGSILILLNLTYFMWTTNRFFIESRQNDIKAFHLFGLKYYQICLWFICEFVLIGIISFIFGIGLGALFSKIFSMILVKAMGLSVQVHFYFSLEAFRATGEVMTFIIGIIALQTLWLVSDFKFSRRKKKEIGTAGIAHLSLFQKILAVTGILLILSGWLAAFNYLWLVRIFANYLNLFTVMFFLMLAIFCVCVIGTYLVFVYTIRWHLLKKNDGQYHNLRILTRSEMLIRTFKDRRFLATITISIGLALALLGAVAASSSLQMSQVNEQAPVSLMMDQKNFKKIEPQVENLKGYQKVRLPLKAVGAQQSLKIIGENTDDTPEMVDVMALSDYQKFRQLNPRLAKVSLKKKNQAVMLTPLQSVLKHYLQYSQTVHLSDRNLAIKNLQTDFLGENSLRYGSEIFIVSDETFAEIQGVSYTLVAVNVADSKDAQLDKIIRQKITSDWVDPVAENLSWKNQKLTGMVTRTSENSDEAIYRLNYVTYAETYREGRNAVGLQLYVFTFVTMTFILTTASTVSLRQLSQLKNKRESWKVLRQLGIPEKYLMQQIYRENFVLFFPPAAVGLLHSLFAVYVFQQIVNNANYWFVYLFCGILLAIYILFYFVTCQYQKRLI